MMPPLCLTCHRNWACVRLQGKPIYCLPCWFEAVRDQSKPLVSDTMPECAWQEPS